MSHQLGSQKVYPYLYHLGFITRYDIYSLRIFLLIRDVIDQIAGRAVQRLTQAVQRGKANRAGLVRLENGQVVNRQACRLGQILELHSPV